MNGRIYRPSRFKPQDIKIRFTGDNNKKERSGVYFNDRNIGEILEGNQWYPYRVRLICGKTSPRYLPKRILGNPHHTARTYLVSWIRANAKELVQ